VTWVYSNRTRPSSRARSMMPRASASSTMGSTAWESSTATTGDVTLRLSCERMFDTVRHGRRMRRRGERPSLRVCARLGVVPMAGSREGSFPRHADHRDGRLCRGDAPVAGSAFARGIRARGSSARRLTHSNRSASSHATTPSRAGTSRRIGLHIASLCTPTVRCLTCCCGVVAQSLGTTAGLKRPTSSPSAVGMRTGRET